MGDTTSESTSAADLRGGDHGHRFMDQGCPFGNYRITFYLGMTGHCPHLDAARVPCLDVSQVGDFIQVNQNRWLCQAKIQHRHQTLTTG